MPAPVSQLHRGAYVLKQDVRRSKCSLRRNLHGPHTIHPMPSQEELQGPWVCTGEIGRAWSAGSTSHRKAARSKHMGKNDVVLQQGTDPPADCLTEWGEAGRWIDARLCATASREKYMCYENLIFLTILQDNSGFLCYDSHRRSRAGLFGGAAHGQKAHSRVPEGGCDAQCCLIGRQRPSQRLGKEAAAA